jgi:integrase
LRRHVARQAEDRLRAGGAWTGEGYLFTDELGRPIHPEIISKTFDRIVMRAGLRRIRLHDLRHTAASLAIERGFNLVTLSKRLGHATVAFTLSTYGHSDEEQEREAALGVAQLVGG